MKYILIIIAALFMFGCDESGSGDTVMQKPARCSKLLRFSIEGKYGQFFDVAECVNPEGNKAVFIKPTSSSKWDERVMLEK